jgi:hypothetical protein
MTLTVACSTCMVLFSETNIDFLAFRGMTHTILSLGDALTATAS